MKKTTIIVLAIIIIAGLGYFFYHGGSTPVAGPQGQVVFSIIDAATNLSNISAINLSLDGLALHSTSTGWTTISTATQTFDLLALKAGGQASLLASTTLPIGTYDQIRLMVSSVTVTTKNGSTTEAKVPSGELQLNGPVVVTETGQTSVNLDFLADASLHLTGNGLYIFAPVVKVDSKSNATIDVDSNNHVMVHGGKSEASHSAGMDIDGQVKENFQIKPETKLEIDNGEIKVMATSTGGASVNVPVKAKGLVPTY